mmetsp:Transcript_34612/g.66980  ORF Transcript_34612/g.66980 Transcript_34612/m.66980 type:complete len:527 (+) Transcript_34612:1945-3525(+)
MRDGQPQRIWLRYSQRTSSYQTGKSNAIPFRVTGLLFQASCSEDKLTTIIIIKKCWPQSMKKRRKHPNRQQNNLRDMLSGSSKDFLPEQPPSSHGVHTNFASSVSTSIYPAMNGALPSQKIQQHDETQRRQQHPRDSDQNPPLQAPPKHFRALWIPRAAPSDERPTHGIQSETVYHPLNSGCFSTTMVESIGSNVLDNSHHETHNLHQFHHSQSRDLYDTRQELQLPRHFEQNYKVYQNGSATMLLQPHGDRNVILVPANMSYMEVPTASFGFSPMTGQGLSANYYTPMESLFYPSYGGDRFPRMQNLDMQKLRATPGLPIPQYNSNVHQYTDLKHLSRPQERSESQQLQAESQEVPHQLQHRQSLSRKRKSPQTTKSNLARAKRIVEYTRPREYAQKQLKIPTDSALRDVEGSNLFLKEIVVGALSEGRVRSWAKLMSDLTYAEVLNCGSRFKNTAPKQQRSAYNFFMLFVQSIMEKDFIEKKRIQSQEVMRGIGSLWSSLNPRDRKWFVDLANEDKERYNTQVL